MPLEKFQLLPSEVNLSQRERRCVSAQTTLLPLRLWNLNPNDKVWGSFYSHADKKLTTNSHLLWRSPIWAKDIGQVGFNDNVAFEDFSEWSSSSHISPLYLLHANLAQWQLFIQGLVPNLKTFFQDYYTSGTHILLEYWATTIKHVYGRHHSSYTPQTTSTYSGII